MAFLKFSCKISEKSSIDVFCLRSDVGWQWFLPLIAVLFAMALLTELQCRCENSKCAPPGLCSVFPMNLGKI